MTGGISALTVALEAAITAVKENHEGIPDVVLVVGGPGKGQVHGHFAPKRWAIRDNDEESTHEIMLAGESFNRGGVATFGTLVHELAHAYCDANDIRDTSNRGRYHSQNFKRIANEFGLDIEKADTIGWSVTHVPDETVERYKEHVDAIDAAIRAYRKVDYVSKTPAKKPAKWFMACPECQDPVPIGKKWFTQQAEAPYCRTHDEHYELEQQ